MSADDSPSQRFLAEFRLLEARLGDEALYRNADELHRVSERLTELQPALTAFT